MTEFLWDPSAGFGTDVQSAESHLAGPRGVLRVAAPLIISVEEVDLGLEPLDNILTSADVHATGG